MAVASLPPGPRGQLLQGNLPAFRRGRLDFLVECCRDHGDIVALRFGPRRIFLVNHPDAIEEVLVTRSHDFIKHFALRLNPLVLGQGLLTSEGDFWLRQRRLIQPTFGRSRIAAYAPDMVASTERLCAAWSPGETRDLFVEMTRLTLEITARTLFGVASVGDTQSVNEALQVLQENFLVRFNSLLPLPIWIPTPTNLKLRQAVRRLDKLLFGLIQQRRANGAQRGDLLSILLNARAEDDGTRMTDQQLRDEAMTLFLAGHETTALALSWLWYLLCQHPEAEERLLAELDEVLGGRLPTFEDLPRLRFAEWAVLESMRIYPPVYTIGREAIRATEVGGYRVPRGTTILMNQWVVHRDPRFFDDPEEFRPERWSEERMQELPRYAYFPFGGGPRICIGNTFAMMEMVLVLATIAPRFRFRLRPGHVVVPWATFTLRPQTGIPALIERR